MSTNTANLKALRSRRTDLCYARRVWELKVPNMPHFDYTIGCRELPKPDPAHCEGCCATLYRADRLAEIGAGIKAIDDEITAITGKPYWTPRPKQATPNSKSELRTEQLPLFT